MKVRAVLVGLPTPTLTAHCGACGTLVGLVKEDGEYKTPNHPSRATWDGIATDSVQIEWCEASGVAVKLPGPIEVPALEFDVDEDADLEQIAIELNRTAPTKSGQPFRWRVEKVLVS